MSILRRHPLLIGWLAGIATVAAASGVLAALILFGGLYNTGANDPHLRIVAWAFHQTMTSSVKKRAQPLPADALRHADLIEGARIYEAHCIACHGGPGVARARWASALLPTPPYLLDGTRRWTPAQLVTIIRDGVKLTAMPAWGEVEPDRKINDVVALLIAMPRLSPKAFADLRKTARQKPDLSAQALWVTNPR